MNHERHKKFGNFRKNGSKTLLHGVLLIHVIRAEKLRNKDGLRSFAKSRLAPITRLATDLSDPYVTVTAEGHRLVKTGVIKDDLNPTWDEAFYIPVAQYVSGLVFTVWNHNVMQQPDKLGRHFLDVKELVKDVKEGETFQPRRVIIQKVVLLDEKISHGLLDFYIEYTPYQMLPDTLEVPGVYFKEHEENLVKLYINADDIDDGSFPLVTFGGVDDQEKEWIPPRLWKDIYDAICDAKHFIYIAGWSVDTSISLLRDEDYEDAVEIGKYSSYIGKLLKQKADEGVTVNILLWDDMPGMMNTRDKETKAFFENTNVTCQLARKIGDDTNNLRQKFGQLMFTHHQKTIILDASIDTINEAVKKVNDREMLAFVGGIDLTNGRWDHRMHPLFRSLTTDHKGDAYNACFNVDVENVGPRQPWRDIHCSIRGPGTRDILANFTERWNKQAVNNIGKLVDLRYLNLEDHPRRTFYNEWHTQVFRSIDSRTANFNQTKLKLNRRFSCDALEGITFEGDEMPQNNLRQTILEIEELKRPLSRRFETSELGSLEIKMTLMRKKGRDVDASIHTALVHHIRKAKHCIYIETQYFLGNSHMWKEHSDVKCGNIVASEILLKICEKIEKNERFAVYVVIPMWPEGKADSVAVQSILYWQYLTIDSMYTRIAKLLRAYGNKSRPTDYLNFYCLGNRESVVFTPKIADPNKHDEIRLHETRRHQIYVHSKMFIFDDAISLIGSANVNQRSLDGARDSEIVLSSYQPYYIPTSDEIPHGDVHGFRLHCWASLTNCVEDVFKNPSSLDCVHRLNKIAEDNWLDYIDDEAIEMNSYLLPYPYHIDCKGGIHARPELHGYFPDTKGRVLGSYSTALPDILTT